VPDAVTYEYNTTRFECESFETMNWSLIDNYVVTMGKGDTYENAALLHTIKCTTCRLMLLPAGGYLL